MLYVASLLSHISKRIMCNIVFLIWNEQILKFYCLWLLFVLKGKLLAHSNKYKRLEAGGAF